MSDEDIQPYNVYRWGETYVCVFRVIGDGTVDASWISGNSIVNGPIPISELEYVPGLIYDPTIMGARHEPT